MAPADLLYALMIGTNTFMQTFSGLSRGLERARKACLSLWSNGEAITSKSLANNLGISTRTALVYIKALEDKGMLVISEEKKGRLSVFELTEKAHESAVLLTAPLNYSAIEKAYESFLESKRRQIPKIKIFHPIKGTYLSPENYLRFISELNLQAFSKKDKNESAVDKNARKKHPFTLKDFNEVFECSFFPLSQINSAISAKSA